MLERFEKTSVEGVERDVDIDSGITGNFSEIASEYAAKFKKDINQNDNLGYLAKKTLPIPSDTQNDQIFTIGDIHGDLNSLIALLNHLKKSELLDENYKCKPGVHVIFLGDLTDRGTENLQVLELALTFHRENPDQVHILRGNHENVEMNTKYNCCPDDDKPGYRDLHFQQVLNQKETLQEVYETMPLGVLFAQKEEGNTTKPKPQVMFVHGIPDITTDLEEKGDWVAVNGTTELSIKHVPKIRQLNHRVTDIAKNESADQYANAKTIEGLWINWRKAPCYKQETESPYNWGDLAGVNENIHKEDITQFGLLGERQFALSPSDLEAWMDFNNVATVIRGHEHELTLDINKANLLKTVTLPKTQQEGIQGIDAILIKTDKTNGWTREFALVSKDAKPTPPTDLNQKPIISLNEPLANSEYAHLDQRRVRYLNRNMKVQKKKS